MYNRKWKEESEITIIRWTELKTDNDNQTKILPSYIKWKQ